MTRSALRKPQYDAVPATYEELAPVFRATREQLHHRNAEVGYWALRAAVLEVGLKALLNGIPRSWRDPNSSGFWLYNEVSKLQDANYLRLARVALRRAVATDIIKQWREHGGDGWSRAEVDRWLVHLATGWDKVASEDAAA